MFKHSLPLALILAWIPNAYAFPPCPVPPVSVDPIDPPLGMVEAPVNPTNPPWYRTTYALVGDPTVIDQLLERSTPVTTAPRSKCRDRVTTISAHASSGIIGLSPAYAPISGFGLIALPDLRNTQDGLTVPYTLDFSIENQALDHPGDWVDLIQLMFHWNDDSQKHGMAAVYRFRKLQQANGETVLQVIESRRTSVGPIGDRPNPISYERVVVSIALDTSASETPVQLHWSQATSHSLQQSSGALSTRPYRVDSVLKVVSGDETLYRTELPDQWADTLSIGLLDYNADREKETVFEAVLDNVYLSANAL
jgi:hypothetical protein